VPGDDDGADADGRDLGAVVPPAADEWRVPTASLVPGETRYRDGQKVRHRVFGEGRVVSTKLTRDDEEVTVAFPEQGVKKLMASLANLEVPS